MPPFLNYPRPQDEMLRLAATGTVISATGASPPPAAGNPGNFDGLSLGGFDHGYGFNPNIPKPWCVVVNVIAIKTSAGNETYLAKFQESEDGSTWTDISAPVSLTAIGVVPVYGSKGCRFSRIYFILGGTSPSLTYEAWLNPNVGKG